MDFFGVLIKAVLFDDSFIGSLNFFCFGEFEISIILLFFDFFLHLTNFHLKIFSNDRKEVLFVYSIIRTNLRQMEFIIIVRMFHRLISRETPYTCRGSRESTSFRNARTHVDADMQAFFHQ